MKKKWALAVLSFALIQSGRPLQGMPYRLKQADAGIPGEWLSSFSACARDAGLANASTALEGPAAAYANPAGLAGSGASAMNLMVAPLFSGAQYQTLSVTNSLSNHRWLGASLLHLASGKGDGTDELGRPTGSFDEEETALFFTYGTRFFQWLDLGTNLKAVHQSLADYSANGYGLDLGWRARFRNDMLSIGMAFQNLVAPRLQLKDEKETFPLVMRTGSSLTIPFYERRLLFSVDWIRPGKEASARWAAGAEFNPIPTLPFRIRAGTNQKEYTAGFGIEYGCVTLDYALSVHELAILHRLGVTFRYGLLSSLQEEKLKTEWGKIEEKEAELQKLKTQQETEIIKEREFVKTLQATQLHIRENNFNEARKGLEHILKISPQDPRAQAVKKTIGEKDMETAFQTWFPRAKTFYANGEYEQARKAVEKALSYKPYELEANSLFLMSMSRVDLARKDYAEARKHLMTALQMDPENPEAMSLLKRVLTVLEVMENENSRSGR